MKPIKNFSKLHEASITTLGMNNFIFEVGNGGSDCNTVWVFDANRGHASQSQRDYCTLMTIDWEKNEFDLRKCVLGQGIVGEDIHNGLTLPIRRCKTMADFSLFVTELIENEIKKGTYKN